MLAGTSAAALAVVPALAMTSSWSSDVGQGETLSSLQGHYAILSMFYTSCRRICPQSVNLMRRMQQAFRAHGIEAELVLVSYAAEEESPLSLADFRSRNQLDLHWHLLAGSSAQTRDFASRIGLENYNSMDDHIFHDFSVVLVEPDGSQRQLDWRQRDAEALVNSVLAHQ